ncbi:MAG: ribosome-associated translation inhibitor RaiA [Burkholderiales bacterium]|nr:ribosome-associated translation inhibitor RaiA [Burkholderiales bacterium]
MQIPLQVSFQGMARSDALVAAVEEKASKLERYFDRITSCRVVLAVDGRHHRHGRQYRVRIDLTVPGGEIAVTREHHEDVHVALRDAFDAARRRLEDHVRAQRGDVKRHAPESTGRIARLDAAAGIGFIVAPDGRELYFSRENVVAPPFEHLAVGMTVHFLEDAGAEGPQAKRVSAHRRAPGD